MAGRFRRGDRWLLVAWLGVFVGCFVYVFLTGDSPLQENATRRDTLRVYSNPAHYGELQNAVEFGLERLNSLVNYLLLAAAGLLGFTAKSLTELHAERSKGITATRAQLLLVLHAGIACFFSLFWGGLAYVSLPDIAVVESFAITGQLSRFVISQIVGLLFAALLLLVALGSVVRELLP